MDFTRVFSANNGTPTDGLAAFDVTPAAPEFVPLPSGIYSARVLRGELTTTKAGADAYRIRFEILDGEHKGRTVIRTWTFSARALGYTKRDLSALGLTSSAKLLAPFPEPGREYTCRLMVALQRDDCGRMFNDVKKVEVLRVTESPAAAFMLPSDQGEEGKR